MTNRILILFAHPRFERSLNNSLLVSHIPSIPDITFHDLYQMYPDFNIDVETEKKLLTDHDIIIFQHPFYWYGAPPLVKQWIDLVLEFGWAYGPGGIALKGKAAFNCITVGGPRTAYTREGYNKYTVAELLTPINQTVCLCNMDYLPPFAMHGTHRTSAEEKNITALNYGILLKKLVAGSFKVDEIKKFDYLNDWLASVTANISAQ